LLPELKLQVKRVTASYTSTYGILLSRDDKCNM
jgi:hypothetical protein